MPKIIINNEELDMQPGEVVLDVARRNASHIGFACDGNGLCQMCECLVNTGAEHLSPPNETEHVWLTQAQLQEGRRLGCQASLRGPGPVEVITRAEELLREAQAIVNPPAGTTILSNLGRFVESIIRINVEHIRKFPGNTIHAMTNFLSVRATLQSELHALDDAWRITSGLLTGQKCSFPLLDIRSNPKGLLPSPLQEEVKPETPKPSVVRPMVVDVPAPEIQPSTTVTKPVEPVSPTVAPAPTISSTTAKTSQSSVDKPPETASKTTSPPITTRETTNMKKKPDRRK
jgi:ferredoxin